MISGCSNEMLNQVMIWTCPGNGLDPHYWSNVAVSCGTESTKVKEEEGEVVTERGRRREESRRRRGRRREDGAHPSSAYEEAVIPPPTYQEALLKMVSAITGTLSVISKLLKVKLASYKMVPPRRPSENSPTKAWMCREDDPNLLCMAHTRTPASIYKETYNTLSLSVNVTAP
ncbi:hypothetical protein Hamer_G015955, partial [Homarus americanus]